MSIELLMRLQEAHAFDHAPLRHDLGVYHVPFEELVPGQTPETTLIGAVRRESGGSGTIRVWQVKSH